MKAREPTAKRPVDVWEDLDGHAFRASALGAAGSASPSKSRHICHSHRFEIPR